jgi:hypothetical protein
MTWHQWHHSAPTSSRTNRFSAAARANGRSDQASQGTAVPPAAAAVAATAKRPASATAVL